TTNREPPITNYQPPTNHQLVVEDPHADVRLRPAPPREDGQRVPADAVGDGARLRRAAARAPRPAVPPRERLAGPWRRRRSRRAAAGRGGPRGVGGDGPPGGADRAARRLRRPRVPRLVRQRRRGWLHDGGVRVPCDRGALKPDGDEIVEAR